MCDFVEIWNLRQKLILDGYYDPTHEIDGLAMERQIMELARKHYNWKEPEPGNINIKYEETKEWLECMTAEERLSEISGILLDWDGYRTVRGLGGLIDEVLSYACYKKYRSIEDLKRCINFWKATDIKTYLDGFKEDSYIKFTVPNDKMVFIKEWCKENHKHYEIINVHNGWGLLDIKIMEDN